MSILFEIGTIYASPTVAHRYPKKFLLELVKCHQTGSWKGMTSNECERNIDAIAEGGSIVTKYATYKHEVIIVLTQKDRSETLLFFPDDDSLSRGEI